MLRAPGGPALLYERAPALERAGIFDGSDWAHPEILQADIAVQTLRLGAAGGHHPRVPERAAAPGGRGIALCPCDDFRRTGPTLSRARSWRSISMCSSTPAARPRACGWGAWRRRCGPCCNCSSERIGYDNILDRLIGEIWRILAQRPVRVDHLKAMVAQIAACLYNPEDHHRATRAAPIAWSARCSAPPRPRWRTRGWRVYRERLDAMDSQALQQEASGFARAMHDTGLVSPYLPVLLRFALERAAGAGFPPPWGSSSTGREGPSPVIRIWCTRLGRGGDLPGRHRRRPMASL